MQNWQYTNVVRCFPQGQTAEPTDEKIRTRGWVSEAFNTYYLLYVTYTVPSVFIVDRCRLYILHFYSYFTSTLLFFLLYVDRKWKFKVCKSVHHLTIQINHQPDATIFQFIILTFVYSSTCFGRFPAHHQELNDCSGSLWFYLRIAVIVVLCSWSL